MILRLATSAAVHTAGGVVFGVTAALAACTVAQVGVVAFRQADRARREGRMPGPQGPFASSPYTPAAGTAGNGTGESPRL